MRLLVLAPLLCASLAFAQYTTTPVPILKQINRHNEDGSYSYGFEAADGSYKIESKYPTGEVYGKYGFVDDGGNVREIEYGASSKGGFEPIGTGINVPPSALSSNSITGKDEPEDDGQYREDPSVYHTDPQYTNGERYDPVPKQPFQTIHYQVNGRPANHGYGNPSKSVAAAYRQPAPVPQQYRPEYQPQYRTQYQHQYRPAPYAQPQYPSAPVSQLAQKRFEGHPASNVDINLGSYSVHYRR